jgi:hypothetical protein
MNHARLLRPLAAAVITLAIGAAAAPAEAASPALYTAPPVPGPSPGGCGSLSGSTECFLDDGNWAGYLAVGSWSGASFINVQASFSVPSLNCATTAAGYAGQGVGLGGYGFGASNGTGVESAGVTAQCVSGSPSYQARWETYPQPETDAFTVNPGDAIAAQVSFDITADAHQNQYHFTLTDTTTGQGFSVWQPCAASACLNSSAEVMSSASSGANDGKGASILPLADYGAGNFEGASLTDHSNQSGGFISSAWPTIYELTQISAGGTMLATSGSLYGGQAFSDAWKAAS